MVSIWAVIHSPPLLVQERVILYVSAEITFQSPVLQTKTWKKTADNKEVDKIKRHWTTPKIYTIKKSDIKPIKDTYSTNADKFVKMMNVDMNKNPIHSW